MCWRHNEASWVEMWARVGGGGTSCEWAVRMCIEDICAGMGSREQGRGGVEALDVWGGEGEVGIQFL